MIAAALALAALPVQAPALTSAPRPPATPGLLWIDVDQDGDLDALALGAGGTVRLLAHHGDGYFADETDARGLAGVDGIEHVLSGDADGDGAVELVLGGTSGVRVMEAAGGVFVDATAVAGIGETGPVAALAWVDADQDRVLDLHVTTRAGAHRVFAGVGDGTFAELDLDLGLAPPVGSLGGSVIVGTTGDETGADETTADGGATSPGADRPGDGANTSGGTTAATSGGPDVASIGSGPPFDSLLPPTLFCAPAIEDQASTSCIAASSTPTLGMLYPITSDLYVDAATGNVGIGTTFTPEPLTVQGQILSGTNNTMATGNNVLAGGSNNSVTAGHAVISGGSYNTVSGSYSVIGGGGGATAAEGNEIEAQRAVISGGSGNSIIETGATAEGSVIAGGSNNIIQSVLGAFTLDAQWSAIGGGSDNLICGSSWSTIGGGTGNDIFIPFTGVLDTGSTIGGGEGNRIEAGRATIAGGLGNDVFAVGGTIGGGWGNTVTGTYGTVAGGDSNVAGGTASTVPGGETNEALGDYSLAAGFRAKALHDGAFVWADHTNADFSSTGDDQFLIRATGGVGIGTTAPNAALDVVGDSEGIRVVASSSSGTGVDATGGAGTGIGVLASGGQYAAYFLNEVLITGGTDVEPSGGAQLQCGLDSGQNLAFDSNEIMARNNGAVADLALNNDGGNVEMIANGAGRVGIGTNSPAAKLDVFGESSSDVFRVRVDGTTRMVLDGNGTLGVGANFTPTYDLQISASAPNGGTAAKPGGGSWSNSSDRRLKKNIEDLEGALDTLLALRGVTYEYKDPDAIGELHGTRIGFIAQEVEEVIPDWVSEKTDGMRMLTIRGFEALTVEALRELDDENDRMRDVLRALRERVDSMEGAARPSDDRHATESRRTR